MRKIIFTFITSVLFTFSSFAFADNFASVIGVPVESIKYDDASMVVKVRGILPNRCAVSPHPTLLKTDVEGVLELNVIAHNTADKCIALVGGKFELAFDMRSLKFDLVHLNLDPEATYKIISKDGKLDVTIDFKDVVFNRSYASAKISGGVFAVENNGRFVVVVSPTEAFLVKSPFINMNAYIGQSVELQGHVVRAQTLDMIPGGTTEQPSILVTGISTIAQ